MTLLLLKYTFFVFLLCEFKIIISTVLWNSSKDNEKEEHFGRRTPNDEERGEDTVYNIILLI